MRWLITSLLAMLIRLAYCGSCLRASAVLDKDDLVRIEEGNFGNAIAWGSFKNEINHTGWSYLEVFTNESYNDELQAYAAGVVEAHLTRDLFRMHYNNLYGHYCDNQESYCTKLRDYLDRNLKDTDKRIHYLKQVDPYWYQVGLIMKQLKGLSDVYEGTPLLNASTNYVEITRALYMQIEGDLIDLEPMLQRKKSPHDISVITPCSVLIKVLDDNSDIYFAHDTWTRFNTMLRVLKKYTFPFKVQSTSDKIVPGHTLTMSSYPGKIVSLDDFYLLSTGLAVTETTNSNDNPDLYNLMTPEDCLLAWVRCLVANRLATTAEEWAEIVKPYNSGTYNNQYMVLDYKLFTPGQEIKNNTFWIVEQMPAMTIAEDMSYILRKKGFWSSFNVPYFPEIFEVAGQDFLVQLFGDEFTHDNCTRARIFDRDQGNVKDLESMTKLMRQNDYKHDPLSACNCDPPYNPARAISSRCDLLDPQGRYEPPGSTAGAFGATDMKLTNLMMFEKLQFIAVSGPTHDQVPVFQWSTSGFQDDLHEGHPDVWNFDPIYHQWGDC